MDCWPTDDRDTAKASDTSKGRKSRKPLPNWTYPVVEHGSLGAAALHRNQQRLEWSFVVQDSSKRRVVSTRNPVQVFPETFGRPARHDMSVLQRADQGVQFLRTYYPDFEMSAELVREEIAADARASQALQEFDPYLGSTLETFTCTRKAGRSLTCLAFPMGDSYFDLNISPLTYSRKRGVMVNAIAKPIHTFQTPIQQLTASVPQSTEDEEHVLATLLGVRTRGSTALFDIEPVNAQASTVEASQLVNVTRSDVGNRPIVDMFLPATERTLAILVSDAGAIYRCAAPGGTKQLLHSAANDSGDSGRDVVWKVAIWDGEDNCLAMSGRNAYCIDFRAPNSVVDLYTSNQPSALLTSIETHRKDRLIRLVTTSELLWFDVRSANKPLFGVKHFRDFDRTLRSDTKILAKAPITFLTSQRNGLVSVYDVSQSGSTIRMASPEYCLPRLRIPDGRNLGHVFVQHPHSSNSAELSALQLSEFGAVHIMHLAMSDDIQVPIEGGLANRDWSDEVEELDERVKASGLDVGPLGARTLSEANLRQAYQRLFMDLPENDHPDAVYDLLEKIPMFWQEVDPPIEHALTTFDIAYRCGPELPNASRNDLFTESVLNSKRGSRALMQGRIPIHQLARRTPWHLNITSFVQLHVPDLREDSAGTFEQLSRYDLASDGRRPAGSLRRETEAREQLTLDLHLSSDVFSPSRCRKPAELDIDAAMETMSRATEAMSLGDMEPSDVLFGFLHPVHEEATEYYSKAADTPKDTSGKHLAPLGVRLLLKDWDVGVDPSTYRYEDPYDVSNNRATVPRFTRNPPSRNKEPAAQWQRPPLIVPTLNLAPPHVAQSGSQPMDSWNMQSSSQIPFASTQIVPGPYGGRPGPPKKPAKKRVVPSCRRATLAYIASVCYCGEYAPSYRSSGYLFDSAALNESLRYNKAVVCAISASYISTFAGYPLDSIKSRLQTTRERTTVPKLALQVYKEEGVIGFYRGLWIPLITISFVRAASFTIYTSTKEYFHERHWLAYNTVWSVASTGGIGGALSGSLISFGSAPFELVKVRRQLEYSIAASKGVRIVKAPGTLDAVRDIFQLHGLRGLYLGFRLHFVRDTLGTGLYFFEYDAMRHLMGRLPSGEQGPTPYWMPIPASTVPFMCGSLAGVTSWALIYPLDVVKTKVQQRALAGERSRTVWETLYRLIRGPDPASPKPILMGLARLYRGLGVSALRSITTHGLLWTFFDLTASYIDNLPRAPDDNT
ncbi:hypothetical protein DAEQUDRAFT_666367 [Daedalea quercina L-15889]|uniref:RRN6 beta-propeller domain-containing protein n=1 Tax=Daedalea quercina L-15889 TaxID=1314783 RepID=A0A165RYR8_9APHY|nr:hypothetical protein DAEQUDRAFT_666367 [Daedalea quercina L-15889]